MPKGESEKPKEGQKPTVRKNNAADDKRTQRRRFIDAARAAEADESGMTFEKAFQRIVPATRKQD